MTPPRPTCPSPPPPVLFRAGPSIRRPPRPTRRRGKGRRSKRSGRSLGTRSWRCRPARDRRVSSVTARPKRPTSCPSSNPRPPLDAAASPTPPAPIPTLLLPTKRSGDRTSAGRRSAPFRRPPPPRQRSTSPSSSSSFSTPTRRQGTLRSRAPCAPCRTRAHRTTLRFT